MIQGHTISLIIPALNEAESLSLLLPRIPSVVDQVLVIDNGSTDQTSHVAKACGATVIIENERGYGAACLAGIAASLPFDILVFLDADGCDDPDYLIRLCEPIIQLQADFVLGSRMHGTAATHLTFPQRFGNKLACWLMNTLWQSRYTDLGPFRAIRQSTLGELDMRDRNFGWTVEMQVKAAMQRVQTKEINVPYRARLHGVSKVSGTWRGVVSAGSKILYVIAREAIRMIVSYPKVPYSKSKTTTKRSANERIPES